MTRFYFTKQIRISVDADTEDTAKDVINVIDKNITITDKLYEKIDMLDGEGYFDHLDEDHFIGFDCSESDNWEGPKTI